MYFFAAEMQGSREFCYKSLSLLHSLRLNKVHIAFSSFLVYNPTRMEDASQETGDRRQETGDRRQKTGDRRQKTEDRRQKTEDRRQKTEDRRTPLTRPSPQRGED